MFKIEPCPILHSAANAQRGLSPSLLIQETLKYAEANSTLPSISCGLNRRQVRQSLPRDYG